MTPRIMAIIEEGAKTLSIGRITSDEKEILGILYKEHTGEDLNLYCGGCLVGACVAIYNKLFKNSTNENEKRKQKRNGKGGKPCA